MVNGFLSDRLLSNWSLSGRYEWKVVRCRLYWRIVSIDRYLSRRRSGRRPNGSEWSSGRCMYDVGTRRAVNIIA